MTGDVAPIVVQGAGRDLAAGGAAGPVRIELRPADFAVAAAGAVPIVANYRDATTIAVDQGKLLLILGGGAARFVVEQLGDKLGLVVGELRERRARQQLHDRFIEVPYRERLELVEYQQADEHGVAQIAYHEWGVALLPVDERRSVRLVRRADIATVVADPDHGTVTIQLAPGPGANAQQPIQLAALGDQNDHHRQRLAGLRVGAATDAATIIAQLLPDAPFQVRQRASSLLVDGIPASQSELAEAWPFVERAVLVDPTFAASYHALVARGTVDGQVPPAWLALAPRQPIVAGAQLQTDPDESDYMSWFLVGLPGNLVAFELVSAGSHATYLFRIVSRAQYGGQPPAELIPQLGQAVYDISESLIDARFLREMIYLTDAALADPRYTRHRFAIAALPSLQMARWRFVGRLIHRDDATWAAALDDAIKFNGASRDDAQVWPGGVAATATDDDGPTQEGG
ncbi:MAG TPA: hypothetical protein VIK08_10180 [Candidatus Limnocylindrales bacterium]